MNGANKLYKSDSLHLSAFLVAKGCELIRVEPLPSDNRKRLFCFTENSKLQSFLDDYFSLRALIRPQDFANAQRTLKSIIYSKGTGGVNHGQ